MCIVVRENKDSIHDYVFHSVFMIMCFIQVADNSFRILTPEVCSLLFMIIESSIVSSYSGYFSELSPEQQQQLIRLQQQLGAAMEEQVIPALGRIFKKAELCCKATLLVLFVFLVGA